MVCTLQASLLCLYQLRQSVLRMWRVCAVCAKPVEVVLHMEFSSSEHTLPPLPLGVYTVLQRNMKSVRCFQPSWVAGQPDHLPCNRQNFRTYKQSLCVFDREDTFLKEHAAVVAVATSQAVQVEVDRFSLATSLLAVAARAHCGLPAAVTPHSPPEVLGATPPDSVKAKFEKQVGTLALQASWLLLRSTLKLSELHNMLAWSV